MVDGPAAIFKAPQRLNAVSGPSLLTVREVAAELRVSTATVYGLIDRRELAHVRVSNAIRVAATELAAYLRTGGTG